MPVALAPVAIGASGTVTVDLGGLGTVGAVVIANESPYGIQATAGAGSQWIAAQTIDILYTNNAAFSGVLTLTTNNYLSNAGIAPSFIALVTGYAPGERIPGVYPASLARVSNVGNIINTPTSPATAFEQDFLTPFVLNGLVATKDGQTPNALDVASGVAFLTQSDSSQGRVAPISSTHLTSTPNATYYLDLNPDGTWSFATTHSATPFYLAIAQATTDASGNIVAVTDERVLTTFILATATGLIALGGSAQAYVNSATGDTNVHHLYATASIAEVGGLATAGSFGVPVIIQSPASILVTDTLTHTLLSFIGVTGALYRVSLTGSMSNGGALATAVTASVSTTDAFGKPFFEYFLNVTGAQTNALNVGAGGGPLACAPLLVSCGGGSIIINYQDAIASGSPVDHLMVLVERLS